MSSTRMKYPAKAMIFAGISHDYKSRLILVESGTIDANSYVNDFVDQSAVIPEMNARHGIKNWVYMQDGVSVHTAASTMTYLRDLANVLEDWPAGSPDLNPIENLWAIVKRRVEELGSQTKDELIDVVMTAWESIKLSLVNNLMESIPTRLNEVVMNQGAHTSY